MTDTSLDTPATSRPCDDFPLVINPDDYLETEFGREFTPERNHQAWELAYARLDDALSTTRPGNPMYLVMGVQGAGKSRWVSENLARLGRVVVFDAALPARRHRERLLAIARGHDVPVIGVFIKAPLALALARNARRSADKRVPEEALRSVFSLLEPPGEEEGFIRVQIVEQPALLPSSLHTARLTLVAPSVGLADQLADALNASYALHRNFLAWSKPHWTLEETRESLEQACAAFISPADERRYFVLRNSEAGELVGCIGLLPLTEPAAGFEIGYWANQRHAGQGLMKEALSALVTELSGHTLRLTASSANLRSQKLAESAGFECVEVIKGARACETFGVQDTWVYLHTGH